MASSAKASLSTRLFAEDFLRDVRVFCFDVFGTVLDWRNSMIKELDVMFADETQFGEVNWGDLVTEWRQKYMILLQHLASSSAKPQNIDVLHRQVLDTLLASKKWEHVGGRLDGDKRIIAVSAWHRCSGYGTEIGWPDSSTALYTLKKHAIIGTLANGTVRIFVDIAKYADLPWDFIFTGELLGAYKPSPQVYLAALNHLSILPEQCVLVAAHAYDVRAAAALGFKTIYVRRSTEDTEVVDETSGVCVRDDIKTKAEGGEVDLVVEDLEELAKLVTKAKRTI